MVAGIIFVILLSGNFLFLAFQNCFIALNVENPQYYIHSFIWYPENRIPH